MKIKSISDPAFSRYGKIIEGYDFTELLSKLEEKSPRPEDSVVYVPSVPELEALPVFEDLRDRAYGGMPIQIGYCNGSNTKLNCVEYHRDSEIDIAADDIVLLVGVQQDIVDKRYNSSKIEAFLLPRGMGVELYATTLHYAPCNASSGKGFRVIIVLPKGTNTVMPKFEAGNYEDEWMTARNKWLLAHGDSSEAKGGAYAGIDGENIDISHLI